MKDFGTSCRDVRTREVGIQEVHHKVVPDQVELIRRDYYANGGWETFLSYEDPKQDILIGLLRLRKASKSILIVKSLLLNQHRLLENYMCMDRWYPYIPEIQESSSIKALVHY